VDVFLWEVCVADITDIATVDLDSLVGVHTLDGVDLSTERVERYGSLENANVMRLRLDGKVYTAVESPDDGYRSSMDRMFVEDCKINNEFPPVQVLARKKDRTSYQVNDTIELIDLVTGKVVVEVGTDNSDDYYPSFVSAFWPENMVR
jgi:hypothetical protein